MIFESRFITKLQTAIADQLTDLHNELGSGNAIVASNASATGMKCAQIMGKISGLKSALEHIRQVDAEMNGKDDKKKRDD